MGGPDRVGVLGPGAGVGAERARARPRNAGLMTPASGLTFAWNNIPGANNLGITVESFSDDALKRQQVAEHIQVKMAYDMKVVGADLGVFFKTIVV